MAQYWHCATFCTNCGCTNINTYANLYMYYICAYQYLCLIILKWVLNVLAALHMKTESDVSSFYTLLLSGQWVLYFFANVCNREIGFL